MPELIPQDSSQLDPKIVKVMGALKKIESGGDYNAVGDNGQSHGAYQWNKDNFKNQATQFGLDPSDFSPANQNKVAYARIKSLKDQGRQPEEIAAIWNGAKKTSEGKYTYINPQYGEKFRGALGTAAPQQSGSMVPSPAAPGQTHQPSQQSPLGGALPPPQQPQVPTGANMSVPTQQPQEEGVLHDLSKGDYGGAAVKAVKGVGNFLFPIVGDIYHDVKGDSQKTFLQQTGDAALSALPFIPGLGEAGLAAKGAKAAEGAGLLGRIAGSTAAKGAATGYGAGVASNLSQGKGIVESVAPNANNLLGAATGGIAPSLLKGASTFAKKIAGIDPQIETELTRMGAQAAPEDASLYQKYLDATKAHAVDLKAKPPLTMAADELDSAAAQVTAQRKAAGAAAGEAKKAGANIPLGPLDDIGKEFSQQVREKYGLVLGSDEEGNALAAPLRDSMRQVSAAEKRRIEDMATQLNKLHEDGNVKKATEVMDNFNELIDHSKDNVYGRTNDPLEGLIKSTAGNLSAHLKSVSPEIASTYEQFSGLKNLEKEIKSMAGNNLNRGELLMRRVFSGDKSGDVQDFFTKLQQATGIDLTKHAVLAKHAIQTVGSKADKTLLEQIIGAAADAHGGGLMSGIVNMGRNAAQKTFANPEKIGRNLVKGKKGGLVPSLLTKSAISGAAQLPR